VAIRYNDDDRYKRPWWETPLSDLVRSYEDGTESEQDACDRLMEHTGQLSRDPLEILMEREDAERNRLP